MEATAAETLRLPGGVRGTPPAPPLSPEQGDGDVLLLNGTQIAKHEGEALAKAGMHSPL